MRRKERWREEMEVRYTGVGRGRKLSGREEREGQEGGKRWRRTGS